MVMVEIVVPAIDKEYDFRLDEYAPVQILVDEIVEMVCHKEQSKFIGNEKKLNLCHLGYQKILSGNLDLKSQGIKTGDRLMLI